MVDSEPYIIFDERHVLANFGRAQITLHARERDGVLIGDVFETSEQLYQMCKFLPSERLIRSEIMNAKSPREAKDLAKKYGKKKRPDWDKDPSFRYRVMSGVIRLKVRQNPDVAKELLATGDREIVEDADKYAPDNPTKEQVEEFRRWGKYTGTDGEWIGDNWMGKILMDLRRELQEYDGILTPSARK